ncbi:hypothetical protein [Burkholderia ubonensis]|uniref:hypothetical protein n=1 Tax=Burkholderia ubonensis TaxID=101571 RepID=UPI00075AF86E|nr:hypothetical protein [Burkholderia ubonensis]KVT55162.1 hypothetical protein WK54_17560 [Burkholderia ubonensis]
MRYVVILTKVKGRNSQQLSINHPYQAMRARVTALLMLAGDRLRPMVVGERLSVNRQLVYNWAYT